MSLPRSGSYAASTSAKRTSRSACRSRTRTGHLRGRGADPGGGRATGRNDGAPPRARSGPAVRSRLRGRRRGTSAGAERTRARRQTGSRAPGHLRGRGADITEATGFAGEAGHLRGRGADTVVGAFLALPVGAPPRARSGHLLQLLPGPKARGTSAGAERTSSSTWTASPSPGHLRGRGADMATTVGRSRFRGAPPRARSGRGDRRGARPRQRGTSAGAERTSPLAVRPLSWAGHLRGRGADRPGGGAKWPSIGAPPRARSGRVHPGQVVRERRGTSAGAERTLNDLRRLGEFATS